MDQQTILNVFNTTFTQTCHTRMIAGAAEPLYVPAHGAQPAQLWCREDYAASALHEAAHWCIAGPQRRNLPDFGYAYLPPPRTRLQQDRFFNLELKTQTLESIFAGEAGLRFTVSADNLDADCDGFTRQVAAAQPAVRQWMLTSRDDRARRFCRALADAARARQGCAVEEGAAGG